MLSGIEIFNFFVSDHLKSETYKITRAQRALTYVLMKGLERSDMESAWRCVNGRLMKKSLGLFVERIGES